MQKMQRLVGGEKALTKALAMKKQKEAGIRVNKWKMTRSVRSQSDPKTRLYFRCKLKRQKGGRVENKDEGGDKSVRAWQSPNRALGVSAWSCQR
jgi:hypothetical protein